MNRSGWNLTTEFPARAVSIEVRAGDANTAIRDLCKAWDKRGTRGVLFLDPFGMQVEWSTIEAIAAIAAMKFEVLNRNGYSNISGRSCPPNSMILSAGMFRRLAASRIASALGASYRQ